ncbi:DUF2163 domain-containing protein [Polymorphobacter sp.]|uniref:DUF2163 domain-containing protein n=1 Tax=Polymorphobacter sp. TaxID=1909290 RepID=UPI003F70D2F1
MAALAERLTAPLTMLVLCWRIVRGDGVALGFTSHDRPLTVGGMRYEHAPGISPSAVVSSDGLEIDTMEVAGALSASAITATDLLAGRYDGAAVELFLVDWRAPDAGRHALARGRLGAVEAGDGPDAGFVATLLGPTAALQATAVESYSPECRAALGDRRCRVPLRGRVHRAAVGASDGDRLSVIAGGVVTADLVEGRVRVLDGALAGIERRVIAADDEVLVLDLPIALEHGTRLELLEGCDKRFSTCVSRFSNGANFRGEPHVPGGDLLMRIAGL